MSFPPQDLTCPDPRGCPVPGRVLGWQTTEVAGGSAWFRCYDATLGYDEHNPGFGNARFSPFDDGAGRRVPTMYLAVDETSALLETVFHSVDSARSAHTRVGAPAIYEAHLRNMVVAHLRTSSNAVVADFRDDALGDMGLQRRHLVSSPAEHYPCTRRLAAQVHADPQAVHGIVWHCRQAEVTGHPPTQVLVLFGDRYPSGRGTWPRTGPGLRNLYEGPGRDLVDRLASDIGAVVE